MGTQVTFNLLRDGSHHHVLSVSIGGTGGARIDSKPLSKERMDSIRAKFRQCIEDIRITLGNRGFLSEGRIDIKNFLALKNELDRLRLFSAYFLKKVFDHKERSRLITVLRELRNQGSDMLFTREKPIARIDYRAEIEHFIPIEYIFLDVEYSSIESPRNLNELVEVLSRFLGFAFDIRRIPGDRHLSGLHNRVVLACSQNQKLGIQIYPFTKLPHVPEECRFFEERNAHLFDLEVCSFGSTQDQAIEAINQDIGRINGPAVHHFACHFFPDKKGGQLVLGDEGQQFEIPFDDLYTKKYGVCADSWICFLNACESASATTFDFCGLVPDLFEEYTPAYFIGPEHVVSDRFAMAFAHAFYAHWLQHRDLGLALFKTRWFFAKKYNNPMGLFYASFATKFVSLEGPPQNVFY